MQYSEYLQDPLDEKYLIVPGEYVVDGAIPEEEWEVRRLLVSLKIYTDKATQCGILARLFRTENYRNSIRVVNQQQRDLMELVNKTPRHKAAIRRIVNAMPLENGGREALADYIL